MTYSNLVFKNVLIDIFKGIKITWDTVESAFAFTHSSKYSQFCFVSFTGFTSLLALDCQKEQKSHCADPGNS